MFTRLTVLLATILCSLAAFAQQPAPAVSKEAAARIEPPSPPPLPASADKPAAPVAPPMPGQVKAEPAAAPQGRLPEVPVPALAPVPAVALNKTQAATPSTSGSGQFIVHGNDLRLRNAFSARCDEIKDELSKLLRDQQPWVLPVVVFLNSGDSARQAPRSVSTSVVEVANGGFHLQVTVNLRPDLRSQDLRAEVVRALLLERILRSQSVVTSKRTLLLPEWMQLGVLKALDFRKQARPSTLFAVIFKSGRIFGIEEIIEASPTQMDALSRTIYETSCCALVLALLDQSEGSARLNRFLASLATDARPERELLNLAFPSFASSKASLNKWWALQLANLSRPGVSEPLTPAETLKALEEALTLRFQAKPSEIPRPRPVLASLPLPDKAREREILEPDPQAVVSAPAEEPGKLRSFISMLNPFSRSKASNAAIIESAIESAAIEEARSQEDQSSEVVAADVPVEALPAEGARTTAANERKGFFNRWFGGGGEAVKDAQPSEPQPSEKAANETVKDGAVTPVAPVEEAAPVQKPSRWNPINWFRRGKEPSNEPEATSGAETTSLDFWQGDRLVALVMQQELVPASPPADAPPVTTAVAVEEKPEPKKRGFLGIFGGKKKKEKEAPPAADPMPAPAPADSEKKTADTNAKGDGKAKPEAEGSKKTDSKKSEKESVPAKETPSTDKKAEAEPGKATLVPMTEVPPEPAKSSNDPSMKPEAATTEAPAPATETAGKEEKASSATSTKRSPVTLKSLFGFGKKPEKTDKPEETTPPPTPGETPPAEGAAKMTADAPGAAADSDKKKEAVPAEKASNAKMADKEPPAKPAPAKVVEKSADKKADKPKSENAKAKSEGGKSKGGEEAAPKERPQMAEKKEAAPSKQEASKQPPAKPSAPQMTEKPVTKPVEKPEPPKVKPAPAPAPAMAEKPAPPTPKVEPPPAPKIEPPKPAEKPKDEPLVAAAVPIEDYAAIMKRPDRKEILQHNLAALSALQHRSSVLFRPMVTEYTGLVAELMDGKAKNVDERLQRLRERTQKAFQQSRAVRDLLDLHEANAASAMSGSFEDFLNLPDRIREELPPRQDAISRYLDALDLEFSKP